MNKMKRAGLAMLVVAAICFAPRASAATCTSRANGNWNLASTWGTAGLGACGRLFGAIPTAADDVIIAGNTTVTIPANYAAVANSVIVGNAASSRLASLTFSAATSSLAVATNVTIMGPTSNTAGRDRQILVNAGSLTVNGNVVVNGSTRTGTYARLTLTTGTAAIAGGLTVNSSVTAGRAVVTVGTGTVNVNGAAGVINGDTITVGAGTFNMSNAAATFSNGSATIAASTSISTGSLNLTGHLTNAATGSIAVTGAGNINEAGNWTNDGTFTAGTGTVTFNGTVAQTLNGAAATTFNSFAINNTGGDVTINSASVALSPTVNGTLTLTSGHVVATVGTNVLALGAAAVVGGGSAASHVVGDVQQSIPTGNSSFTFPLGDGTSYQPVTVALAGVTTAGTLISRVVRGDHPDTIANISGIDQTNSANHYWVLTPATLAGGSYTAVFQFCGTVACNVPAERDTLTPSPPDRFIVARRSAGAWILPPVGARFANTIGMTGGVTSAAGFGEFAVGNPLVGVYKGVNQLIDLREL